MRAELLGLGVVLAALLACGGTTWEVGRGGVAVIECKRTADCYEGAADACPYGYDPLSSDRHTKSATVLNANTPQPTVIMHTRGELVVKCRKPVFCKRQTCADGFRCVYSERYPGRAVCALQ
jgi:hypothetical protein